MDAVTSPSQKRYRTLYQYNLETYGIRVQKASLDAGCGCPNRDRGQGCCFCDNGARYFTGSGDVTGQIMGEAQRIHKKWPKAKLIAYFQAGTNTYGDISRLAENWNGAADCPEVVGISIATRADCLGGAVLDALSLLALRIPLTVELGLQTVHDETAAAIGRGHTFAAFEAGYAALQARGIRTCVHLINGLPGERREMMLETARQVGRLRPGGVKLHLLHVNKDTPLAELWRRGEYTPMSQRDYVETVAEQLRYFPPETVIERLTGDGDRQRLLAPLWSRNKIAVLGAIDRELAQRNIWQGDLVGDESCGLAIDKE